MAATGMRKHIDEIELKLAPYGARRLSSKQLSKFKKYTFGWFLEEIFDDGLQVKVALLFSQQYPYETPSVYLVKPELKPLDIPHLEKNGKLCVWSAGAIPDTSDLEFIIELLIDTFRLLQQSFNNQLDDDFKNEFLNYWSYNSESVQKFISLCSLNNKFPRQIFVFKSSIGIILADTKDELEKYLENRCLIPSKDNKKARGRALSRIHASLFLHFESPWLPSQYPKNISQLITLIEKEYPDASNDLLVLLGQTLANRSVACPAALASFETPRGLCIAALEFSQSIFKQQSFTNKSIMNGFRDLVPLQPLRTRMSTVKITGSLLSRNDPSWVLGRDNNAALSELQTCRVAIIGCGSVGASIAKLLVQSGVRSLVIFDGDLLKSENISRHLLGLNSEHMNKAAALAQLLKKDFPHIEIRAFECDWQQLVSSNTIAFELLNRSDLIVSCTGDWHSDQKLLALQSEISLATIVFAFVEAHALAAHVIVNPEDSNAFNSLHHLHGNQVGKMLTTVTSWEKQTKISIPACAGEFQPYGIVPLTHLHAMASEVILALLLDNAGSQFSAWRKVWIGSRKQLRSLGGDWNEDWCKKYVNPANGKLELTIGFDGKNWSLINDEI